MITIWFIWAFAAVSVLSFGAILLVGAPYMPTLRQSCREALDLLDLKEGQLLIELGSGDGAMVKLAAERGLRVIGYELNPFLVVISLARTWRYRRQVQIRWRNFWTADLSQADGVFVFLLDKFMPKLDAKMKFAATGRTLRLVSHAFKVPGRKIVARTGAMYLYKY